MALIGLDHVNIRTADLDGLCRFYLANPLDAHTH